MSKVYIKDGQLCVPDRVTVPYIEGEPKLLRCVREL